MSITKAEREELRREVEYRLDCDDHEEMVAGMARVFDLANQLEEQLDRARSNLNKAHKRGQNVRAQLAATRSHLDDERRDLARETTRRRSVEVERDRLREQLAVAVRALEAASLTQLDDIDLEMERDLGQPHFAVGIQAARDALAELRSDTTKTEGAGS